MSRRVLRVPDYLQAIWPRLGTVDEWEMEWYWGLLNFLHMSDEEKKSLLEATYGDELTEMQREQIATNNMLGVVFTQLMHCCGMLGQAKFQQVFQIVANNMTDILDLARELVRQQRIPFDILAGRGALEGPEMAPGILPRNYTALGNSLPMAAFNETALDEESVRRGYTDIANLSTTQRRRILTSMFGQTLTTTQISALVHDVYLSQLFLVLWEQEPGQSANTLLQWAIEIQANSVMGQSKMALQMQLNAGDPELQQILQNPSEAQRNVLLWRWKRRNRNRPTMASFNQTAIDPGLDQGAFGPTPVDPDWSTNLQQGYVGLDEMQSYQLAINRAAAQAWNYLQRMAVPFGWNANTPLTPEENWRIAMQAPQRLHPDNQTEGWERRERVHRSVNRTVPRFKAQRAVEIEEERVNQLRKWVAKKIGFQFSRMKVQVLDEMESNPDFVNILIEAAQDLGNLDYEEASQLCDDILYIVITYPQDEWYGAVKGAKNYIRERRQCNERDRALPKDQQDPDDDPGYVGMAPLKAAIHWM